MRNLMFIWMCLIFVIPCQARTITVDNDGPADFDNIQAAIDDANDGDEIMVADGNYTGDGNRNLKFNGKAITLKSENGPNDCIIDCQGEAIGFRFRAGEKADSILDGFTVIRGHGYNGGGIVCAPYSSPTITNCIITGCSAENRGGAIYCEQCSPTIKNCTITANWTDYHYGGAICCLESSPAIINCTISSNSAAQEGGGLCFRYGGKPIIKDCTITGNSGKSGGAIYCDMDSPGPMALALINSTITANTAQTTAGAIAFLGHPDYPATLAIANCKINGNSADGPGGAVYCGEFTSSAIASSSITDNSTNAQGAGIYCAADANLIVAACTIAACTAGADGGGIYCAEDSNVGVTYCTIVDNASAENGGGIYFGQTAPFVANSTITGNTADNRGGGIYCAAGIIIDNSLVAGNASDTGGGIYSHDGTNLIENCTFAANKAADTGGGLYCYFQVGSWPYDVPPEFEGLPWGREIPYPPRGPAAHSNISNSIFWDNTAQSGPQIAAESAYTPAPPVWPPFIWPPSPEPPDWPDWMDRFRNPTGLSDESTQLILTDWPSRPQLTPPDWPEWPFPVPPEFPWPPNLPWPPSPPELPSPPPQPSHPRTITIKYSDIAGGQENIYTDSQWLLIWGAGSADTDPCFVEPGYFDSNDVWVRGDYHLLADSPCIDAGDPNYVTEPNETDLDGRPRVLDGNEDGIAAIDMGAYEYTPPIPAEIDINPDNLNLQSKGRWVTCYIWLPEDYNVADIDPNSVLLEDEIPAERVWLGDEFAVAKFSRRQVQEMLGEVETPGEVELVVSGELSDGTIFEGTDTIRVIDVGGGKNTDPPGKALKQLSRNRKQIKGP
jgi:predicted outer membrane repeat protein